jgi:hypothetical protein
MRFIKDYLHIKAIGRLSEIEKGKMCYDLMEKYPEKYPTQEALAKSLGYSRQRIEAWINLYKSTLLAASNVRSKVAKFEPKKKEKKTIASRIIYVPSAESNPINIIEIHLKQYFCFGFLVLNLLLQIGHCLLYILDILSLLYWIVSNF